MRCFDRFFLQLLSAFRRFFSPNVLFMLALRKYIPREKDVLRFSLSSRGLFFPLCSPQFDAFQTASSDAIAFKLILNKAWVFPFFVIGALGNWWIGRWNVYATKRWQKVICGIGVRSNSHFEGELVVIRATKICIKCSKHGRSYFYQTSSSVCFNRFWPQNWQSPHLYVN